MQISTLEKQLNKMSAQLHCEQAKLLETKRQMSIDSKNEKAKMTKDFQSEKIRMQAEFKVEKAKMEKSYKDLLEKAHLKNSYVF